jgi:hypothetical protein
MRRDPAACAAMSDPLFNREFRRGWELPPPIKRIRPAGQGQGAFENSTWDAAEPTAAERARQAAEALFERVPA